MTILLILLLTLDFKRLEPPDEAKSFAVSTLGNEASTGCATNPQSGSSHPLIIERSDPPELVTENTANWVSPIVGKEGDSLIPSGNHVAPMVFESPGGKYYPTNPDPPSPPTPVTPEPSTVAILGITAAVLIALLFGRHYARKPSRHS